MTAGWIIGGIVLILLGDVEWSAINKPEVRYTIDLKSITKNTKGNMYVVTNASLSEIEGKIYTNPDANNIAGKQIRKGTRFSLEKIELFEFTLYMTFIPIPNRLLTCECLFKNQKNGHILRCSLRKSWKPDTIQNPQKSINEFMRILNVELWKEYRIRQLPHE